MQSRLVAILIGVRYRLTPPPIPPRHGEGSKTPVSPSMKKRLRPLPSLLKKRLRPLSSPLLGENERGGGNEGGGKRVRGLGLGLAHLTDNCYIPTLLITALLSTSTLLISKSVSATTSTSAYQASRYRELGLSYQRQERYPEAIATMKKSVELDPNNINGRVNLGWTQHLAGQEDAAAKSLQQAASLNPFSVPTFNALGIVYLVKGDLRSAVLVHTWAAMLQPDDEVAYYNMSLAFHRLRVYDSAITTATKAATLEPSNPHPLMALAIAHWDSDDRNRAQLNYRKALDLDSRYKERGFLAELKKAGFSSDQIQTTQQIFVSLFGK